MMVIRAIGASPIRSSAGSRTCAGSGQPLPSPWIVLLPVPVTARPGQTGGPAHAPCSPDHQDQVRRAHPHSSGQAGEQSSSDPGDSPVRETLAREITGTR